MYCFCLGDVHCHIFDFLEHLKNWYPADKVQDISGGRALPWLLNNKTNEESNVLQHTLLQLPLF